MEANAEEYPGVGGGTWGTEYLTKLAELLVKYNILLKLPDKTSTAMSYMNRRRRAAVSMARALAPPVLTPSLLYQTVDRFKEIYLAKLQCADQSSSAAPAPAWVTLVKRYLQHAGSPPDPAESVLRALTERARAFRTTDPGVVCRKLEIAPQAARRDLETVWDRMVAGVKAKLDALIAGGDSEAGLQAKRLLYVLAGARLSRAEWRLVDALLLFDDAETLSVVREEHARRAEPLRALVAVFHLVQLYHLEDGGGGEAGSERERGGWRAAAAAYRRRGRLASAVLLQRRWHDLKLQTRARLAAASHGGNTSSAESCPAPLHLAVARRFPRVALASLPPWCRLVQKGAVLEECDLTADVNNLDELPELPPDPDWTQLEEGELPPPASAPLPPGAIAEAEDDLILVEREIETVDLLAADDDDNDDSDQAETQEGLLSIKREMNASPEQTREVLRARRREMALALEKELDRQLRDLDGVPGKFETQEGNEGSPMLPPAPSHSPLIIYDSDESRSENEMEQTKNRQSTDSEKSKDEQGRTENESDEAMSRDGNDEEPSFDAKLFMDTSVPLMRVDSPGWRELVPLRPRPAPPPAFSPRELVDELLGGSDTGIRIVSIKSEEGEEGGRRGRIRLPDIAEVRRINRSMLTAQVAPLVAAGAPGTPAEGGVGVGASRRSSVESELCIDEGRDDEGEGGVLTGAELRRVLRGLGGGGGLPRPLVSRYPAGARWRELYCCAARYHRALNDARRRCAARGGRQPPPDAPVHAARCLATKTNVEGVLRYASRHVVSTGSGLTDTERKCECCCRHLLDAEGAARALVADRQQLLDDVRAIIAGTYSAPRGEGPRNKKKNASSPAHADGNQEEAESAVPVAPRKQKKRKRDRTPRGIYAEAPPEPASDPLQEWIRQKNLTSRFFDLNLKKPPPKPAEPPPIPAPPPPPIPVSPVQVPPLQPIPVISALSHSDDNKKTKTVNKIKVTVKTGKVLSSRSLLLKRVKEAGGGYTLKTADPPTQPPGRYLVKQMPVAEFLQQVKKARMERNNSGVDCSNGLPPDAIPVTMLQTTAGMRLVPLGLTPAPVTPSSDVIDLSDDDSPMRSPVTTPSPPSTPPSHALLKKLPPGISVKRKEVTPPPKSDGNAQKILSSLPSGIQVKRRVVPAPAAASPTVLLNDQMPSQPVMQLSPLKDGNSNIKVFQISSDGFLTPTATVSSAPRVASTTSRVASTTPRVASTTLQARTGPPRIAPKKTKVVLIPRKGGDGGTGGTPPKLLNSILAGAGASSNSNLKIAELRTTDGKRVLMMRPPTDGRPLPADGRLLPVDEQHKQKPSFSKRLPVKSAGVMTLANADAQMKPQSPQASKFVLSMPNSTPSSNLTFSSLPISVMSPMLPQLTSTPTIYSGGVNLLTTSGPFVTPNSTPILTPVSVMPTSFVSGELVTTSSMFTSSMPNQTPAKVVKLMPRKFTASDTRGTKLVSGKAAKGFVKPPLPKLATVGIPKLLRILPANKPSTAGSNVIPSTIDVFSAALPNGLESICVFEMTPEDVKPKIKVEASDETAEGDASQFIKLDGGATVRRAEPSHDFSDLTMSVEEWNARGGAPLVQVMERGVSPYRAGGYYVRTSRPLPFIRAAVWTPGPVSGSARLLVCAAPTVRSNERAYYLRLAAGVIVRAEWVCRTAGDVASEARAGADLYVVHAATGHGQPMYAVRPPRPGMLALRCKFLTAAQQINQDVNQSELEKQLGFVRIAPRPPPPPPAPAPAPAPLDTDTETTIKKEVIKTTSGGQSLLKPIMPNKSPDKTAERPLPPPTRTPTPPTPEENPATPPARSPTPPARSPTPPARSPTPPEPRRSSRRAAHDARAKLTDLMKDSSTSVGNTNDSKDGGSGSGDEGLDFSTAAGLEAADSDDDYNADDDMRRERKEARRGRGNRHSVSKVDWSAKVIEQEFDDNDGGSEGDMVVEGLLGREGLNCKEVFENEYLSEEDRLREKWDMVGEDLNALGEVGDKEDQGVSGCEGDSERRSKGDWNGEKGGIKDVNEREIDNEGESREEMGEVGDFMDLDDDLGGGIIT